MQSKFWTVTFAVLIGFFLIAHVASQFMIFALFLTIGLALPLLALNTVLLYLVAAWPAIRLMRQSPRRWGAVAAAACIVPLVAVGLPKVSELATALHVRALLANDISGRFDEPPKSVELVSEASFFGGDTPNIGNAPCEELCQRLLVSRSIDFVRVTRLPEPGRTKVMQLDYAIETRDACPDAFRPQATLLDATKDAMASGLCFVTKPADASEPAARFVIRKVRESDPRNLGADVLTIAGVIRELQTLEISAREGAKWSPRLRQTSVQYTDWSTPLYLSYGPCSGTLCMGLPVFGRTHHTRNAFDSTSLTLQTFRIDGLPPPRLSLAARVMAMLDHAGNDVTESQKVIIRDWATNMPCSAKGCPPPTAEDVTAAMRLVADRRVTEFAYIGGFFERNRKLVADNLDRFIGEMEARGANSDFSNRIGATLARLDIAEIRPYRERLLKLIEANDWKWSHGMANMAGRLGADTAPLIAERLGRKQMPEAAVVAACFADPDVGERLVPHLIDLVRRQPENRGSPGSLERTAFIALAHHGHSDEAKELFQARYPKLNMRYLPRADSRCTD